MPNRLPAGRAAFLLSAAVLCMAAAACAPNNGNADQPATGTTTSSSGPGADACANPHTVKSGILTIATDSPAYNPWFSHDDPTNGKGFESAVAYAVAKDMGFGRGAVTWTKEPFNASYQPGPKSFDFDINQISINSRRAQAVTFSDGYYSAAQAIITLKDSPYAGATSLADFGDATLGAQVFDDTNIAKNALLNGQIDGIVVDLPTAFYITAVEITQSTIVGQFQPETGQQEQFGLLFEKGNPLVACANQALATLKSDGTLAAIEKQWLSEAVDAPRLDS